MIEVYIIVTNKYEGTMSPVLQFNTNTIIRGNNLNWLIIYEVSIMVCKYSFTPKVVNSWNSLPDYVVDVHSVDVFKKRLDKFWSNQPVKLDWRASLTKTGDRSKSSFEKSWYVCLSINIGNADIETVRPWPLVVL